VLHERLLALDRPATLRQRLTTGRLIVRLAGDPSAYLDATRAALPDVVDFAADGTALTLRLSAPERQTPILVAALVAAGARVLEVRAEMPALEDVYLHLMGEDQSRIG
jgi:hypothetical protein